MTLNSLPNMVSIFRSDERDNLCKRLGIKIPDSNELFSNLGVWACIGMALAKKEPEFSPHSGKRGRRKATKGEGEDYLRAMYISKLRREMRKSGETKITDKLLIKHAIESRHPAFIKADLDTLIPSVSRGNSIAKKARLEIRALWAENFRHCIQSFRRRQTWLIEIEPLAKRLESLNRLNTFPNSLLSVENPEKSHLRGMLVRPVVSDER